MAFSLGYTVNWEKQDRVKCIIACSGWEWGREMRNEYTQDYIFFERWEGSKLKTRTTTTTKKPERGQGEYKVKETEMEIRFL